MSEIIPALLPKNPDELNESLSKLPQEIKYIHLDILESDVWAPIDREFEVHLMVEEPEKIVEKWIKRGAKRIIAHKFVSVEGVEFGLALGLDDPIGDLDGVDFVHLMSIDEIGEQGHPFNERIFDRIKEVREKFPQMPISVDGGINTTNYQALMDLKVDRLIVGSGFKNLWQSLKRE